MKGIYLTEEGKKEIESKIAELESSYREYADWEGKLGELKILKEILSSGTIILAKNQQIENKKTPPPQRPSSRLLKEGKEPPKPKHYNL